MKPVIDLHAHIFRGKDIPLKGYLLSRRYEEWYIKLLAPLLFSVIAKCIRRERAARGRTRGNVLRTPRSLARKDHDRRPALGENAPADDGRERADRRARRPALTLEP